MIDMAVAVLFGITILAMGELIRWAWRVHDRRHP